MRNSKNHWRQIIVAVLLALAWTATAPRAMAQDYSWNNTADGNWSESNDWTPSNNTPPYPDSTNAAVTVPTSSGYTISITNGTDTINSLTATGTGYVTISGGTLVMDGTTPTIDAGVSNTVTIDSTLQLNETTTITQGEDTLNLGTVTGPGGLIIDTTGGLTVGITSAASYTGATTLEASGQLGLPGGTAASSGFDLTTSSVYLGIAGNETINNLSGSGGYVDIYGYTFTVVNTTNNTFAGTINGDGGSLVVNSTNDSTLVLSGDNTYTGGTTVSGGILEISSQSNIGAGGLTLGGGEMLTSTNATFTENVTLNSGTNDTLAAVTDTTATYNGIISGSNALTINDGVNDGTVVLTTNNTYTGGTTISAGVLQANTNNALGTGAVTVDSGASLQLNGGITLGTNNNIIISGTGAGGAGAIFSNDGDTDNVDGTVTLANSASIVGSGDNTALALNGSISLSSNDLTLEATNGSQIGLYGQITGSGGITVTTNEGFEHGVDLLGSTSNTYTGTTTVENGGALDLDKSSNVTAISGNLEIDGGEVWDFSTGQLAASSVLTLTSNGLFIFVGSGPQTETIAGLNGDSGTEIATGLNVPVTLILNETGNYNYAGNIEDTYLTISLVKEGAGTQILSGTNDYAGGTTINGGILEISSENNIGGTNAGGLTLGGGELLTSSNATFSENVTLNSGTNDTLAAVTDTTATYNGIISGSNALTINDGTNDGTVALNGNNIYTGGTTIESGTVIVGTNNAFGTGTVFTIDPTITYTNSVTVTNPIDMMGDTTLEVDSSNSATQAGVISGTDTDVLTKAGTGTLILSATNTYTGATVISAGTLAMGTNGSIASSSEVDLTNSGTTFDISNGGSQTIQNLTGVSGSTVNLGANNLAEGTVDSTEFDGVIEGAGGSLTVQGGGLLILTGSNTYTGGTTIDAASYLVAENSNALGSGAVTLSGNGTLEGGPGVTVTNAINLGSGGGNIGNFGAYAQTTFSGAIALNSNNLTIFSYSDVPASTTLSGGITGTGNLTLISDNSASVILSGASVNNTGTITNEGTGTSGTTISAAIGSSVTGVIQDSATSSLTLTHANTYAGGTTVTTGDLIVGNASALGTGSVAVNGGTLTTTGLGIGIQIAMDGNYNQGANGTLALNLYSSTNYDSLNLTSSTGVATVDGTLELNLVGGFAPGSGEKFAVITTSNQVEGAFTTVTTSQPTIGFTVDYTDDVTVLFQEPFATLPGADLNPNQLSVARYIDQHDLTSTNPGFNSLVAALNGLSGNPGAFGGYLDQLTSLNFANFAGSTAFNNASFWTQAFDSYLANHRGADGTFVSSAGGIDDSGLSVNDPNYDPGLQAVHSRLLAWNPPPSTGQVTDVGDSIFGGVDMDDRKEVIKPSEEPSNLWNVFVSGNVVLAQDFSDATAGTSHADATTGAAQAGIDFKITPHLLVGATFAYGHTHATLDDIGSTASVDTYSPGIYASYTNNGWYANALGSYGFDNYNQSRNVSIGTFGGTATSHPGGDQIVGDLDGGYDFHRGPWTFGPTLGVQYVHLDVDGYTESGLPGDNLIVNQDEADSLRSSLGGRINYAIRDCGIVFNPHLSASWQHEFMDQSRGITSQFDGIGAGSFVVNTPNPSRDSALIDVGLDAQVNNALTVFTDYTVQAGQSNYFGQSVEAGFKIGF